MPERRYGVLAANAYLWLTYLLASWVFLRHPRRRRLFVRHEEFLAEPATVVRRILLVERVERDAGPGDARDGHPLPGQPPDPLADRDAA